MVRRRKKANLPRSPRVVYKKQQSYHYSSRRSVSDRVFNRQEITHGDQKQGSNKPNFITHLPTYISILLILLGTYYLLTLSTKPDISVFNNNAKTQLISKDLLAKRAEAELKKSFINRIKPTFNEQKLELELLKLSPEITKITIKTSVLKHRLQIMAEFSEPALVLSTGSNLYVIGSDGKVLADITHSKEGFNISSLPLVQDQTNIDIKVGKIALTSSQVDYIQQIRFQTDQKQLNVSSMIIQAGGSQLDVKYVGLNYYVKYNFFENARKSSGVFLALKEKLDKDGVTPLEYIDVRVPERAYIK